MSKSNHTEPYSGAELADWLLSRGARLVPVKGGGLHAVEVAPGRIVKLPHGVLTTTVAKFAAGSIGLSYQDMRAAIGHPIVVAGRRKSSLPTRQVRGRSKTDVLACSRDAHRVLTQIEQAIKPGLRDSAFYGRVHESLSEAKRLIDLALSEATSNGTRRSA